MDFELLIITDCPNSAPAAELFTKVMEAANLNATDLKIRELRSETEAQALGFHGSPTFAVAGQDLFASAAEPALSCRVYPTPTGLAGLPVFEELLESVNKAIAENDQIN
ncbi:hypothetical protein [Arthrobacter sp. MYb227]|uniref:hypothetical protein n=1 Tax=Arthrobacter sp. MYb227 TaxID=1848601 RepID=UPI0015E4130C|nr:hypothetical protein [Arthrobacter sp. MYb227]